MVAVRENSKELAELSNQARILKQAFGIPQTADYEEIKRNLKAKGLLQQDNQTKYFHR